MLEISFLFNVVVSVKVNLSPRPYNCSPEGVSLGP